MRLRLMIAALVFAILLALLEWLAVTDFLYWRYVWFDTVMHFVGGLTLGTFIASMLPRFNPIFYALAVLVLVVGWEVFEAFTGMPHARNFFFDTSVDLLMDAIGAIVAYAFARATVWRSI